MGLFWICLLGGGFILWTRLINVPDRITHRGKVYHAGDTGFDFHYSMSVFIGWGGVVIALLILIYEIYTRIKK
jgi:hypothetical protein